MKQFLLGGKDVELHEPMERNLNAIPAQDSRLRIEPLIPSCWKDFEQLFGEHGAYAGCWCMWWRITRKEFARNQGEGNRKAMQALVQQGVVPGVLGYMGDQAVAWCSVAPRDQFGSLNRSPILGALDDLPVWSLVCFYIQPILRGQGLLFDLIGGVKGYARGLNVRWLEAYPTIPKAGRLSPVSSFMGLPSVLSQAGFKVLAHPSPSKLMMRCDLADA